jgi:hypothetical protein
MDAESIANIESLDGCFFPEKSTSGDICHYDIKKLNDKLAKKVFDTHCKEVNLFICCAGNVVPFSIKQMESLHAMAS